MIFLYFKFDIRRFAQDCTHKKYEDLQSSSVIVVTMLSFGFWFGLYYSCTVLTIVASSSSAFILTMFRILSYSLLVIQASSFCPLAVQNPHQVSVLALGASSTTTPSLNVDAEVSRRVALVTAAALAAGASPAQAASLQSTVGALEKQNVDQVNANGAPEKHLPQVTVAENGKIQVVVPHVMDPEKPHYIEYVWLKDTKSNKVVAVKSFQPTDPSPPTLVAKAKSGSTVKPMLFCNLHGLWEGESVSV